MEPRRQIGESALSVHPVAMGTAGVGWNVSQALATTELDRFVELGGNLIDTADSYASGRAEQVVGSWMRSRGNREAMVIATKVGKHAEAQGLSARTITQGVEASLERLQTDHIDLLYFHAEDPNVDLEESLSAAGKLIDAGKVLTLGASNFSVATLMQARILASQGLPRFEALTVEYSLLQRTAVESELGVVARAQQMSLMPYFVLANGYFGRYRGGRRGEEESTRLRAAHKHASRRGERILHALDDIAMGHGVDVANIALAWTLAQPGVAAAAVGTESVDDVDSLMYAANVHLTAPQLRALDAASHAH